MSEKLGDTGTVACGRERRGRGREEEEEEEEEEKRRSNEGEKRDFVRVLSVVAKERSNRTWALRLDATAGSALIQADLHAFHPKTKMRTFTLENEVVL